MIGQESIGRPLQSCEQTSSTMITDDYKRLQLLRKLYEYIPSSTALQRVFYTILDLFIRRKNYYL